ncbi:MAG: TonB-dependent copper receptor [Advenella sp.]|nr:TonB-dependent copper receptor [Advenella sp.]
MKPFNHPPIFRHSLLSSALLLAMTASAMAQDTNKVTRLETILVTQVAPDFPLTYTTNPKLPRQPIPASDATDYLKTIPGFSALRNGGSNGDPVLRGMFGSRINILANGSNMPGACGGRMDNPGSYIAPENFDELTVVKGPQTVIWGPGASAGTVRFDRNPPVFEEGKNINFEGSLVGGSWGRNDQAADIETGNDKFYARVTANHSHAQDYKDGDGNKVHSHWDKWNADLSLGITPDANTLLELTAGTGDAKTAYATRGMDGTKFKRKSYGLRFKKQNIGTVFDEFEAHLYYNQADHVMDNFRMRDYTMKMESNPRRTTWGGRVAGTFRFNDNLSLVTGLDFQKSKHELRKFARNGMEWISATEMPWQDNAKFGNTGLFGELVWQTSASGKLIGGLRLDRATAKDYRAGSPSKGHKRDDTLTSGFIRYEHELNDMSTTVYAGLGHVERFPDFWELVSPGAGPEGSVNAFRGIKPEKTTQLDFGAQYKGEHLEAWLSGYVGYVKDFILFDYASLGGGVKQVRNVNARIMGAEMGASYEVSDQLKLNGTLAYAWGKNSDDGRPMAQIPPLETRLSVQYDDGIWSAGALWRLVAPQKRYATNHGNVASKDFGPSAGFGTLALNAGYAFNDRVKLTVGIDNLFDKTYSEHLNLAGVGAFGYAANTRINEPGRTAWARLNIKY